MRKKIAVFVLNMYGAMINDVQRGLNEAAFEENVKLIYFASFSDGFSSEFYDQSFLYLLCLLFFHYKSLYLLHLNTLRG